MTEIVQTTLTSLRKLTVTKQRLTGKFPKRGSREDILSVMRDVAYIQWDPVRVVAPSHLISLWSRIGSFRVSDLDKLMFEERKVFEHWTPVLMLMLTEDYPIFNSLMRRYPLSLYGSWRSHIEPAARFISENAELANSVLRDLRGGPLRLDQLKDYSPSKRSVDGWSSDSKVSNLLYHLHMQGKVVVVGHEKNQNVWGLSEDFLPLWVDRRVLTEEETDMAAAKRALKALGPATANEINYYFVRGRYCNLKRALSSLLESNEVVRVKVGDIGKKEERFALVEDIPQLQSMSNDNFEPRVSLISPFDNMISGRERTSRVFGFDYILEQFLPMEKRKYGTYVLPILWGERLVGRIDPKMDRERRVLRVNAVYAEPGANIQKETVGDIGTRIEQMARFLGAEKVEFTSKVPPGWKGYLT